MKSRLRLAGNRFPAAKPGKVLDTAGPVHEHQVKIHGFDRVIPRARFPLDRASAACSQTVVARGESRTHGLVPGGVVLIADVIGARFLERVDQPRTFAGPELDNRSDLVLPQDPDQQVEQAVTRGGPYGVEVVLDAIDGQVAVYERLKQEFPLLSDYRIDGMPPEKVGDRSLECAQHHG